MIAQVVAQAGCSVVVREVEQRFLDKGLKAVEGQLRLTIQGMKEREESEILNDPEHGLLYAAAPSMRIRTRSGPPTPDDLDDLLAHYQANPNDARRLLAVGESRADATIDPSTLAAWTMLANQLMNLDEVLNK